MTYFLTTVENHYPTEVLNGMSQCQVLTSNNPRQQTACKQTQRHKRITIIITDDIYYTISGITWVNLTGIQYAHEKQMVDYIIIITIIILLL